MILIVIGLRIVVHTVSSAGGGRDTQDLRILHIQHLTWLLLTEVDLDQVRVRAESTPTNGNNLATKNGARNLDSRINFRMMAGFPYPEQCDMEDSCTS